MSFSFSNCTKSVATGLIGSIRTQIAAIINVSESTLTKFNVTCGSLVVTYIQVHASNVSAQDAVTALQKAVSENRVNITVNGKPISVVSSSLTVVIQTPSYATTLKPVTTIKTTTAPTADDDGLTGSAIAGIVIGVIIFLLLLGVIIYFLGCKKNNRKDKAVETNANDVELRGIAIIHVVFYLNLVYKNIQAEICPKSL